MCSRDGWHRYLCHLWHYASTLWRGITRQELCNKDRKDEVRSLPDSSLVAKYSQRSVEELLFIVTATLKKRMKRLPVLANY